jgi:ribonuclease III family protein
MSLLEPNVDRVAEVSTAALAYIGDAVYELHIRTCYLKPPRTANNYHQLVVAKVRAENQAKQLDCLIDKLILSEAESELVKRGRNAAGSASRHIDPVIYQKATGFEALIGYLYLTDRDRLHQIFHQIDHEI